MNILALPQLSEDRRRLLEKMPRHAVCAEIGVWKAEFSEHIDHITQPSHLALIDPWAFQPDFPHRMFGGTVAKAQSDMNAIFQDVCEKMNGDHIQIIRKMSQDAVAGFPDHFFNWVYIDGNHYYDFVRQDLETWFPKVKPGGFLTGDDYLWRDENGQCSVAAAVSDFLQSTPCPEATSIGSQFILTKAL